MTAGVTPDDTSPSYLSDKITAGTGITVTVTDPGVDEHLSISSPESGNVLISSGDLTPGKLQPKLIAGTGISITKGNPGGNENLTIASTTTPGAGVCTGMASFIITQTAHWGVSGSTTTYTIDFNVVTGAITVGTPSVMTATFVRRSPVPTDTSGCHIMLSLLADAQSTSHENEASIKSKWTLQPDGQTIRVTVVCVSQSGYSVNQEARIQGLLIRM